MSVLNLNEREEKLIEPKPFPSMSIHKLSSLEIDRAKEIVHPLIYEGSSMEIYAPSGIGKTWFTLELCISIASGKKFLDRYEVINPRPVFYIDGEMKIENMKDRVNAIVRRHGIDFKIPEGYFELSNPYFFENKVIPKINHAETIQSIKHKISKMKEELGKPIFVVIDNLSCLTDNKENDGDDYIPILDMYTHLKTLNNSICHIHHANKSGTGSRGSSRRHDALDTIIKLAKPNDYQDSDGANFNVSFEKHRNFAGSHAYPFNAKINYDEETDTVSWKITEFTDKVDELLLTEWCALTPTVTIEKVAEKVGISSSSAQRRLQSMRKDGRYETEMRERWGEEWRRYCKFQTKKDQ